MSPDVSVVVCAYTERRWDQLCAAVDSASGQTLPPFEIIVVIDHNPALAARARRRWRGGVCVIESRRTTGLSGARNTGIDAASGDIVAFLDDDAVARRDWLEWLASPFEDADVVSVGGSAKPVWAPGSDRPAMLPACSALDWVIGCTYAGQPVVRAEVRNVMGCNMAFRRRVLTEVGGFAENLGRVGTIPLGCEETELCIRARQQLGNVRIMFEPRAVVRHHVAVERTRLRYLVRRSWAEGFSKALVSARAGSGAALSTERGYVLRVLPLVVARQLLAAARGKVSALVGAFAVPASVACASAGYVWGRYACR